MLTLQGGQSARCAVLTKGELYVALLYNTSPNDQNADLIVVWSNEIPPTQVTLPGTTADQGTAAMVFVSGTDTDFLTLSLGTTSTALVDVVLVSVSMPTNTTGLSNIELPANGLLQDFPKYTRYHAVPAAGWSQLSLVNKFNQFVSLQMRQDSAIVRVLNLGVGLYDGQVRKLGDAAKVKGAVRIQKISYQTYNDPGLQGDGKTWVWMSADSKQNSKNAQIGLQALSLIAALFSKSMIVVESFARPIGSERLKSIFKRHFK